MYTNTQKTYHPWNFKKYDALCVQTEKWIDGKMKT